MKKLLIVGASVLAMTTGAFAQNPPAQNSANPSVSPSAAGTPTPSKPTTGDTVGNNSGASNRDRATVPGNMGDGGTSPGSPNTSEPGASKMGGSGN